MVTAIRTVWRIFIRSFIIVFTLIQVNILCSNIYIIIIKLCRTIWQIIMRYICVFKCY
nr:MAG TPA: hypothetical protein [Caudoviricetes sp.]